MPNEEKMSVDERRKYLKLVAPRYVRAGRREGRGDKVAPQESITPDAYAESGAQQLARWQELTLTPEVEEALGVISRATVQSFGGRTKASRFHRDCLGASPKRPTVFYVKYPWGDCPGRLRSQAVLRPTSSTTVGR